MFRIELTISRKYVSTWGMLEGVRELIQNGLDAKTDGDDFIIRFDKAKQILTIENTGTILTKKTLLLGNTTKDTRSDQIGKFGEGMKLGAMALIREGRDVNIFTGSEQWIPKIELSENFEGEEVLCFEISELEDYFNGVRIEVGPFSLEDWNKVIEIILPENRNSFKCEHGELLLEEKYSSKIFVGGIFVSKENGLNFGYNFSPGKISVDRDRKMVSTYSVLWETKKILEKYATEGGLKRVVSLLSCGATDVGQFKYSSSSSFPGDFVDVIVDDFKKVNGDNAFPVKNFEERSRALFVGKDPVYVAEEYANVLASKMGSLSDLARAFSKSVVTVFRIDELNDVEQENFKRCITLLDRAGVCTKHINIVDFADEKIHGLFDKGDIKIARKIMTDVWHLLGTMIHEVAHFNGEDGSKYHADKMGDLWANIVKEVWDMFSGGNEVKRSDDHVVELRL